MNKIKIQTKSKIVKNKYGKNRNGIYMLLQQIQKNNYDIDTLNRFTYAFDDEANAKKFVNKFFNIEDCIDRIIFVYENGILNTKKSIELCNTILNYECDNKQIKELSEIFSNDFKKND